MILINFWPGGHCHPPGPPAPEEDRRHGPPETEPRRAPHPADQRPGHGGTERRLAAEDRRELNRIGVNLNQITRLMHTGRAVHPGLRAAVERAAALVETILDEGGA